MRYALYFTPPHDDPLTTAASRWLGRDAFTGETFPAADAGDIHADERLAITEDPRRYGFHATLKAPFELASSVTERDLLEVAAEFAAKTPTFTLPKLVLGQLGRFFALVPGDLYPTLQEFSADVVRSFEPFRAALSEADIARRKPEQLDDAHRANLLRWGYPYVMEQFRFHMTLTGQVSPERQDAFRTVLGDKFADYIGRPLPISALPSSSKRHAARHLPSAPGYPSPTLQAERPSDMSQETILSNARIILEDQIVSGTVIIRDGKIAEISEGASAVGEDFEGDYLMPGLVELHTDHLESHYSPRPGVRWNKTAAIQAHDAQIVTSGITTVFDCLRMGSDEDDGFDHGEMRDMADAIEAAQNDGRLRADHLIHLRCEVSSQNVLEHFADFQQDNAVRLVSLMDHAPGQRQFQTMDKYIFYYQKKRGLTDEAFAVFIAKRLEESAKYSTPHRDAITKICHERGITIASHDDATLEHVDEAVAYGVRLAEFPTSVEAAKASHAAGMSVLMGAPNIVRGMSHSGNIAARDLAELGVLDVLSSDYVPFSLLHAPFILADEVESISLPKAIAMVTATPARTVSLDDRGRIAVGLRADLVRVRRDTGVPVTRAIWREGRRVA